jgi:hypothetical protein
MAELFERLNSDLAFIQKLGDNPNSDNGFTAQDLKEWFDKAPLAIQQYINGVFIPQIETKFGSVDTWIAEASKKIDAFVVGTGFVPVDGSVAMTGNLDMGAKKVTNVADPTAESDVVNKKYADVISKNASDAADAAKNAQDTADQKCYRKNMRVTLLVSGWSGKYQQVAAPGVLADVEKCDVFTDPIEASREMYNECVVRCTDQLDGKLTFMCDDIPSSDLTVSVTVLK